MDNRANMHGNTSGGAEGRWLCRGTAFTTSGISLIELIYRGGSGSVVKDLARELGTQRVVSSSPNLGEKVHSVEWRSKRWKDVYKNDKSSCSVQTYLLGLAVSLCIHQFSNELAPLPCVEQNTESSKASSQWQREQGDNERINTWVHTYSFTCVNVLFLPYFLLLLPFILIHLCWEPYNERITTVPLAYSHCHCFQSFLPLTVFYLCPSNALPITAAPSAYWEGGRRMRRSRTAMATQTARGHMEPGWLLICSRLIDERWYAR